MRLSQRSKLTFELFPVDLFFPASSSSSRSAELLKLADLLFVSWAPLDEFAALQLMELIIFDTISFMLGAKAKSPLLSEPVMSFTGSLATLSPACFVGTGVVLF